MDITQFDPTVADLQAIVAETKNITADDLTDKSQLKVVKETRIKLRDARVKITKKGKELREEANAFNKAVLSKEKELLAIVEPEEQRLKTIEDTAELLATIEIRKQILPTRHEALAKIGDGIEATDAQLLEMDDAQFTEYRIARIDAKQEADRVKLEAEQRALDEEKVRIKREQEINEAIEEAKKHAAAEAEERAKREADERVRIAEQAQADAERKTKEAEARAEQERIEADERAKAENARLEKEKAYKKWLKDNSFDEHIMKLIDGGTEVKMYKLVATYIKN
jgi:hypothetical protein